MKSRILPQLSMALSLVLVTCQFAFSQNLAPNPSFETYTVCPETYGNGGPLECAPWQNGNLATSDFFHSCAVGTDVWVPDNLQGSQAAHTGNGYAGFFTRETSIWREYVQAPLLSPCVAGITYQVSFYVSLADNFCATANIGAYLSATPPGPVNNIGTLTADPQIEANLGYINNNQDWTLVTGCFVAEGGEQWITIGNFYNNANTPMEPGCTTSYASYYYVDDVSVEAGDPGGILELELEEDVTTCAANYIIESDVTGVEYHWNTGATTPSITVSISDVYILTITSGCSSAIDSVEITFESPAQVQLGPPTLDLCEGESFNVSLDPTLGEYTWQDGSHSPVYTVTASGLYQVTLENACGTATDEIQITYGDLPSGFSLGEDVAICNGETISYSFDPTLGDFLWQDGSSSADYTISSTGLYSLTISNECGMVSDQILVTQSAGPVVDLGPATINFCENEPISLSYNFNPDLGDYEWQDGNTSASYSINAPGNYAVTVTNECGSTQDEITITMSSPPDAFTLGPDTFICSGESISFEFDPLLGAFQWQDGSASPSYVIESQGVYHLEISNECGSAADTVTVTELAPPVFDLGQDISLCEGSAVEIDLDPSLGEFIWQDGSTGSSYSISQAGTYAVNVSNGCGSNTDALQVMVVSSIEFDLGPDITLCPSQLPIVLDATALHATAYLWQDNSTASTFNVSGAGNYSVTVSNACFTQVEQIVVTLEEVAPQVVLPDDITLCNGDTLLLSSGNSFGDFVWQDQSSDASFMVTQPGTYSLQVTNECGSASDTIHIAYITPMVIPDLGPDLKLCPGEIVVLSYGTTNVELTWQDGSHGDSMFVDVAGIYTLQVSNICETLTDTLLVSVDANPPGLQLQDSIILCAGAAVQLEAGIGGVTYEWSNGSNSSNIEVLTPGVYRLTVSNACGSSIDSVTVIEGGAIPLNLLPDSIALCEGESTLLNPVDQNALAYLWHDGLTSPSHVVSNPGWYVLQSTYSCGAIMDSTFVEVISAINSFSLGSDTTLCDGDSFLLSLLPNGNSVSWQDGSSANQLPVNSAGVYSATISNQCNSYSDTINIFLGPDVPTLDLGPDQSLCPGEIIFLEPNVTDVSFQWSDGTTSSTYTANSVGSIYLTIANECGVDTDTIVILDDSNGPMIELGDTIRLCEGQLGILHGDVLGVDYLWQDGSTSSDLTVSASGDYSVTVSNACGAGSDTVYVTFSGILPSPQLGIDTILCEGNSLFLYSSGESDLHVMWQNGSTSNAYEVAAPGQYILTESNSCGSASDTIVITYQFPPQPFDLGPDTILCSDDFIMLTGPVTVDHLAWNDGSHDVNMIADHEKVYWLEVSNQCGLMRDEITISFDQDLIAIDLPAQIILCPDESITLDVHQSFDVEYMWNTGESGPMIEVNQPGMYAVNIQGRCSTFEAQVEIIEDEKCNAKAALFIPNVFSPNHDGVNDIFTFSTSASLQITSMLTHIFDRWGNEVFSSNEIEFSWDGSFRGKILQPGVYTYLILATYLEQGKSKIKQFAGDVTLMR